MKVGLGLLVPVDVTEKSVELQAAIVPAVVILPTGTPTDATALAVVGLETGLG